MSIYSELVSLKDFAGGLTEISVAIEQAQVAIEESERKQTPSAHIAAGLALSNCEIKMTNFAEHLRERFQ